MTPENPGLPGAPDRPAAATRAASPFPASVVPMDPDELERYVADGERLAAHRSPIKPGCEAGIVWAFPSDRGRTPYSVVYLHGFSATRGEAEDAVRYIAAALGANAFFARLPHHGHEADDAQRGMTVEALLGGAARALAIGASIGHRVILVGTSLGASLALLLAAHHPEMIAAVVAWSPGVRAPQHRENDIRAAAATNDRLFPDTIARPDIERRYWATCRHTDGYRSLVGFMDTFMQPVTFQQVRAPVFLGCYYRNAMEQDESASVDAMRSMFSRLGTPSDYKEWKEYPDGHHALANRHRSLAAETVAGDTLVFLRSRVLGVRASLA